MKLIYTLGAAYLVYLLTIVQTDVYGQEDVTDPPKPEKGKEEEEEMEFDVRNAYCFRFTWLGPEYDNSTKIDQNCEDLMDQKRAKDIPCMDPLVISYDGTTPDMDYLWTHYKNRVACRRAKGQVCAKYSYKFNNDVLNVTYLCTKVFVEDEGPVTSGTYTQTIRGIDVELLVCESSTGDYKPCNNAPHKSYPLILLFVTTYVSLQYVFRWLGGHVY